jgi:enoyl-CoA hydratase
MASLNKPLIAVAPGHSFNSGATLLAASGIPMVNNGSKLAFNETMFGFVPHAGATYYLSRLPGEFGTFLALTGMRIDGSDAIQIGLAQTAVQDPVKIKDELAEIVRS